MGIAGIGLSSLGEMGVYLFSTVMIATFGSAALAAHTIATRLGGVLFAVPLGLSQAMTVRTGIAFGAGNRQQIEDVLQAHKLMGIVLAGRTDACPVVRRLSVD